MPITGIPGLVHRLEAITRTPQEVGRSWGAGTVEALRAGTPARTGRTRRSYQVHAGPSSAQITGSKVADFIDAGVRRHPETPKHGRGLSFEADGRTVFARKVNHPGYGARPFKRRATEQGLERADFVGTLDGLWNAAD